MARKVSGGLVGEPSIGAINVAPTAVVTAATNQNITLSPTGTGSVVLTNNIILNAQNDLRFGDADSSNWVAFQAPATVASNVTWTLPATDGAAPGAGISNQVLSTNGTGTLSWITPNVSLVDQTTSSTTHFVTLTTATTNTTITTLNRSSTKLTFQPSTGTLTATLIAGTLTTAAQTNITSLGTLTGLTVTGVLTATGGTSGIVGYTVQTSGTTLADTDRLYLVANTAAITLTLPLTSTNGRTIVFTDGNNFGSFNVTIGRNTRTIGGLAENLILNLQGSRVELVYYNTDWKLFIL
jgi:hypothetical protein